MKRVSERAYELQVQDKMIAKKEEESITAVDSIHSTNNLVIKNRF